MLALVWLLSAAVLVATAREDFWLDAIESLSCTESSTAPWELFLVCGTTTIIY